MKALLGFLFFMLFLAGLAFVMLQGRQMAERNLPAGGGGLVGVKWRPVYVSAERIPGDPELFVQIAVDGSVKGHGGCNTFFGSLEKTDTGIAMGALGASRMACTDEIMKREAAFMKALQKTRKFEVSGERLMLVDDDDNLLAELTSAS